MRGDARDLSRTVLAAHRRDHPRDTVFCYGSRRQAITGFGAESWLICRSGACTVSPPGPDQFQDLEAALDAWLNAARGRWVVGYIGFGAHAGGHPALASGPDPDVLLFVPRSVLVINADGKVTGPGGHIEHLDHDSVNPEAAPPPPMPVEALEQFKEMVASALRWIGQDSQRRLTVATRYSWAGPVDLVASLAAGQIDDQGLSRSFYLHQDGLELAGTSPELLIHGTRDQFICCKLSGTVPRTAVGPPVLDHRVEQEHELSIDTLTDTLGGLGSVHRDGRTLLTLEELVHGMTRLTVKPKPGTALARLLLGALPVGASPAGEGLAAIARLEPFPRGPYYGLVGCASPDGRLSWSQMLRTVFQRENRAWLPVGAAVTIRSTPDLEAAEVALKASSTRLARLR